MCIQVYLCYCLALCRQAEGQQDCIVEYGEKACCSCRWLAMIEPAADTVFCQDSAVGWQLTALPAATTCSLSLQQSSADWV